MRILLFSGKGGVGKTSLAAATGVKLAELNHRTLVMSIDPAHSLADAFANLGLLEDGNVSALLKIAAEDIAAVDDHLLILHLDGPVTVHRRLGHKDSSRVIPPGGMFTMPGGMDFEVRLGGALQTLHLYLRRGLVEVRFSGNDSFDLNANGTVDNQAADYLKQRSPETLLLALEVLQAGVGWRQP